MTEQMISFMEKNNGYILSCETQGYEFLDQDEKWICFENPNGSADIMWRVSEEDVFFFYGQWFDRFSLDEDGSAKVIELSESIMKDECYLWQLDVNGQRLLSLVNDEPGTFHQRSFDKLQLDVKGKVINLSDHQIRSQFVFWDPMFMEKVTKTPYLN